ncbi:hypothetical protein A7P98_03145 [Eikenella sp. NML080894]|uniref:VirK/YbjX family protein n=1 Tax=Eikenella TaxID=538 RepID=UPI0007DE70CD|nr:MULTISPECIES: DUF535 family protein [Eikenella]OAM36948.1 hypothetical protein A7P98_03145 [Eikenella sp. NML080894]OAM40030.1 hypothetical protein A7P99_02215 [Eikenella sp. NML120348]OAM46165.1 hypothetical protein A7Q03_02485 [Eikenella sp. NML99-0057]
MSDLFHFPTFDEQYPNLRERGIRKYAVVYLRDHIQRLLARRQCEEFTAFINQHPMWAPIFQHNPYAARAVLDTYADNRFGKDARLQAVINNFTLAQSKPSAAKWQELVAQSTALLNHPAPELSISLNINHKDPLEGFFLVSLQSTERSRIYDAVFSFIAPNGLLITSIQGPHSSDAPELIRHTTKQLHGVRPMFMMVNVFKLMAAELGCELYGIPHKSQAKFRWNDSSRLLFNYDAFWQENQGSLDANGYWRLPTQIERTPLEEVQSKKRSMYRKRYEMLDTLEQDIRRLFRSES